MKKLVGQYDLGCRRVNLFAASGDSGAHFSTAPVGGVAEIVICIDHSSWVRTLTWLMHEVFEMAAVDCVTRFSPTPDYASASDGYMFVMDHSKMSEVVARMAFMLERAVDDLNTIYSNHHNPKPKTTKQPRKAKHR